MQGLILPMVLHLSVEGAVHIRYNALHLPSKEGQTIDFMLSEKRDNGSKCFDAYRVNAFVQRTPKYPSE